LVERGYAASTISRRVSAVKGFHRFLVSDELVQTNPAESISLPKRPDRLPDALSVAQINALLDQPFGEGPRAQRDKAMLEILYGCGLRASELVGLDMGCIDFAGGVVRVLGKGLDYTPLALSPEDLQFIESQQFNTTQIARLLGIPASLMLAKVEGTSLTYSNIEQEWLTFAEYTLSAYADEICEALTSLLPEGQWCAPDWDSLHRSDTNTRYSAYQTAISAGFMTVDEARAREGWAPINQTTPQEVTL